MKQLSSVTLIQKNDSRCRVAYCEHEDNPPYAEFKSVNDAREWLLTRYKEQGKTNVQRWHLETLLGYPLAIVTLQTLKESLKG